MLIIYVCIYTHLQTHILNKHVYMYSYNARTKWGRIDYFVCFEDEERGRRRKLLYFTKATARHPSISGAI